MKARIDNLRSIENLEPDYLALVEIDPVALERLTDLLADQFQLAGITKLSRRLAVLVIAMVDLFLGLIACVEKFFLAAFKKFLCH